MKIRTRLTVATGVVVAVICVAVAVFALFVTHDRQYHDRMASLQDAALRAVSLIVRSDLPTLLSAPDGVQVQVIDPAGDVVAATQQLTGKAAISTYQPAQNAIYGHQRLCPPPGMSGCQTIVVYPLHLYQTTGTWRIYAAAATEPWYVSVWLVLALVGMVLLVVGVVMLITWLNVSKALHPVAVVSAQLSEITAQDLSHRVPAPAQDDEIGTLARTVNATLDRLERAVRRLARFTSDASHDLRNPITAMRLELEEVLMHPSGTDLRDFASTMLTRLERFEAIVTDLLELARLDSSTPVSTGPLDLRELVNVEVARRPRRKRIVTIAPAPLYVQGNRMRLARLLGNLLDNAERHAESTITIAAYRNNGQAVLTVTDDGNGIAPKDRDLVFQRFTRLDASRQRDSGGTGLGLPIAREVAEAHGGSLTIEDSSRGARFVLRLPLP